MALEEAARPIQDKEESLYDVPRNLGGGGGGGGGGDGSDGGGGGSGGGSGSGGGGDGSGGGSKGGGGGVGSSGGGGSGGGSGGSAGGGDGRSVAGRRQRPESMLSDSSLQPLDIMSYRWVTVCPARVLGTIFFFCDFFAVVPLKGPGNDNLSLTDSVEKLHLLKKWFDQETFICFPLSFNAGRRSSIRISPQFPKKKTLKFSGLPVRVQKREDLK